MYYFEGGVPPSAAWASAHQEEEVRGGYLRGYPLKKAMTHGAPPAPPQLRGFHVGISTLARLVHRFDSTGARPKLSLRPALSLLVPACPGGSSPAQRESEGTLSLCGGRFVPVAVLNNTRAYSTLFLSLGALQRWSSNATILQPRYLRLAASHAQSERRQLTPRVLRAASFDILILQGCLGKHYRWHSSPWPLQSMAARRKSYRRGCSLEMSKQLTWRSSNEEMNRSNT